MRYDEMQWGSQLTENAATLPKGVDEQINHIITNTIIQNNLLDLSGL